MKTNKIIITALSLITLLFLTGCTSLPQPRATIPMMSDSEDISKKQFLAPKNGKSGLYIYRTYNFVGAARTPTLYLDGNEIGDIAAKSYIFTEIKPGIHTISAGGFFENTDKLKSTFKTESGKNHFVEASFSLGIFIGQVVLEEVAENIGKKGVLETNLAK